MTNLQIIKSVAKKHGLDFVRKNARVNGAYLYDFKDQFGNSVARNWTISSAIEHHYHGELVKAITE
jgi:hypothetical protein